jgi:hypothetical protein
MSAKARIYRPDKNPMQSGKAKTGEWLLEFEPEKPYFVDNLMGWNGMSDMPRQIKLFFPTQEAAVEYAVREQIPYDLSDANERHLVAKAYADNFKFDKVGD